MTDEADIFALQAAMNAGRLTARQLTERHLARIAQIDRRGPRLNAVIEINPDARAIADALDAERQERGPRGPLHGIPILIKDNVDTGDRMQTTAGSLALVGASAPRDAFIVARLRAAGAVILGKTNLSEWANFRSEHSTSGWSSRGGLTRNPYALDRTPCGSSSGSGVAVAADLGVAAIGTETDGSITCPASVNGIVGIKPTVGLASRSGIVPIAHSQDTAGPMARSVADAVTLLGALAGVDDEDPATAASATQIYSDYTQFLDADGLRGARLGVLRSACARHPHALAILETALAALRRLGAEIVDPIEIPALNQIERPEFVVLLYEFKADLNAYLAARGDTVAVHSLEEVIAFNARERARVMPYFGQEIMERAQAMGSLDSPEYAAARTQCLRLARDEGIDAALCTHRLDAIIAITRSPAWPIDLVNGDPPGGCGCSSLAAVAGYPHITVPAGFVFGLPVGLSFFGGAWQEPTLIRLAYAFEQGTRVRRPPRFLPTVDLPM